MPHEIETMAYFGQRPWHGLGTALDENDRYDWPSAARKAGLDADSFLSEQRPATSDLEQYLSGEQGNEIWELWLAASKTSQIVEQCIATTEPAYAAKHVFYLAQLFNNFYHRHHILTESDQKRKRFLLASAAVVRRELITLLGVLGITAPPVM